MELLESRVVRPRQARWCLGRENNLLILRMKRRFAIRAAKFWLETVAIFVVRGKKEFHGADEMRGSFEGAIRVPLRALSFLFNDIAFLCIPRKSLKFHWFLFSIATIPTNHIQRQRGHRSH